jgi:hypothetical protein
MALYAFALLLVLRIVGGVHARYYGRSAGRTSTGPAAPSEMPHGMPPLHPMEAISFPPVYALPIHPALAY